MADRSWLVLVVAMAIWAVVFYLMDRAIMASQGLPVGADLMPL